MDQRTATVRSVERIKPFTNSFGTTYYHDIVLDNGDQGSIGKKAENGIKVGDTLTYTIEPGSHGNKIKQVFEPDAGQFAPPKSEANTGNFQPRSNRGSSASFALSYAKDVMIAAMPFHQNITTNQWIEATLSAASRFDAFLKEYE